MTQTYYPNGSISGRIYMNLVDGTPCKVVSYDDKGKEEVHSDYCD